VKHILILFVAFIVCVCGIAGGAGLAASVAEDAYEIGGPLAGRKLPLFPTEHGEPPGYPGCLAGKSAAAPGDESAGDRFTSQDQAPELLLYPGSVEHYRSYWFKYCPVRSFFDEQSMLKNWRAPDIPGAAPGHIGQYAAPVYWVPRHAAPVDTGRRLKPVPVVRCREGNPVFTLEMGELERGLYALRVIGAVETASLRNFRRPLYLRFTVNDGPAGEVSSRRVRIGYCDEFYSVAELYFHALEKRAYKATVSVAEGSAVELLVHNITLDDVLAGTMRRAIKTRTTLHAPAAPAEGPALGRDERLARDRAIWELFPPLNAQPCIASNHGSIAGIAAGSDKLTAAEIEAQFGRWEQPSPPEPGVFLVNRKLGLRYTTDDLRQQKPLPDPYPLKDDGAGLFWPDEQDENRGRYWSPIGNAVSARWRDGERPPALGLPRDMQPDGRDRVHDAAIALVRYAWTFPAMDAANAHSAVMIERGSFGRDYRCRRRDATANFMDHYANYLRPLYAYDRLFDYIRSSRQLAESVSRFVPWVKGPQDVVELIDVYLVQTTAKRIMRYHYHTDPMEIANAAAVVGDNAVTEPWMKWLFTRTFIYPLPPAGIQDAMITGCCRDGCEYIGSTYYAQGEGAERTAAALDRYRSAGGLSRYNLTDPSVYPKPVAQCYWRIGNVVAGGDFLRIGDVTGPDKAPGHTLRDLEFARNGWRWTKDPKFAFIIRHYLGRSQTDYEEEWQRIEQAARTVKRAPWLDNRSRVMPMWAGVLETGHEHDDMRFRRAAYVRVGFGIGHEHADSLDLQVVAHGLPATIDAGQRSAPRYSSPADYTTRVHNLVEVDGRNHTVYSWVRALADIPAARYLVAEAVPPAGARHYSRQVALIDVTDGGGGRELDIALQRPPAPLPRLDVKTPDSYVFDVVRVSGGRVHTYCFHGTVNDEFTWNAADERSVPEGASTPEAEYLKPFDRMTDRRMSGRAPRLLQAEWRQARVSEGRGCSSEKYMLGAALDPSSPRRYTRLHLHDAEGLRAMKAELVCFQWGYNFSCLMAQKTAAEGAALESAFAAVIEPYMGEPFIAAQKSLAIDNNDNDALRAVAVEIAMAGGRRDVCFADGRPDRRRRLGEAGLDVCGEFAFYSTDASGLRQAAIAGGTLLSSPLIRIEPAQRQRAGRVVRADYGRRELWVDARWPARRGETVLEIGSAGRMTTCTATEIAPGDSSTRLALAAGADFYRSRVEDVEPGGVVRCVLPLAMGQRAGIDRNWVASDDAMRTFWRADVVGRGLFRLSGLPVTRDAFGEAGALRLWEFGGGDTVRQTTFAAIRRINEGIYEVLADVDVTISLRAAEAHTSTDGKTWTKAASAGADGWTSVKLGAAQTCRGSVYLNLR